MADDAPRKRSAAEIARLTVLYAGVATALVFARPTPLTVTFGFLALAAGEALRVWAAGYLVKTSRLVTSGPYRYTRNPLYLGRLLIFTGIVLMAGLPYGIGWIVLAAGWSLFFGYYLPRKERIEPARLRSLHGETYERYFRAVPALFPSLTPFPGGTSGGWSSDRLIRNREHWMIVALAAVALFLLWKAYRGGEVFTIVATRG